MLDTDLTYDLAIPLPNIYPREMKAYICVMTHTWIFIAALCIIVKIWKQSKYPSTDIWVNICGISIQCNTISNKEEWTIDECYSLSKSQNNSWVKAARQKCKLIYSVTKSKLVVAWRCWQGKGAVITPGNFWE